MGESNFTCVKYFESVIFNKLSNSQRREILGLPLSSRQPNDDKIQESIFFFDDNFSTRSQHDNLKLLRLDFLQQNFQEISELIQSDRSEKSIEFWEGFEVTNLNSRLHIYPLSVKKS